MQVGFKGYREEFLSFLKHNEVLDSVEAIRKVQFISDKYKSIVIISLKDKK